MKKALTATGTALSVLHGVAHAKTDSEYAALSSLAMKDLSYAVSMAVPTNAADAVNMFASHGSHSSHSSHSSHYSGSGGSSSSPTYNPPQTAPIPTTSGDGLNPTSQPPADQLKMVIMRVQAALYSKGYDPGAIDGTLSPETKQALRSFQTTNGLPANAKLTTATLNALGVSLSP